jgi:hypothetical protein
MYCARFATEYSVLLSVLKISVEARSECTGDRGKDLVGFRLPSLHQEQACLTISL